MILVDIYVPSVDKVYDFHLNEKSRISIVIDEIAEMIGQKEHSQVVGKTSEFVLCEYSKKRVLDKESTLEKQGVKTGEKLLLV
ncbi:MAG: glutamyl-tRNA amidotransferase [Lachnospiraceae bacterium]|nr:glutamyl-tRNA amidotransferase [Lachnospiraceae bacterium]